MNKSRVSSATTAIAALCSVVVLSGCVASNIVANKRLPTPAEAQEQLKVDIAALGVAGCTAGVLSQAAAPAVSAFVDSNGQRIAQAVDATGSVLCKTMAPAVSPATVVTAPVAVSAQ